MNIDSIKYFVVQYATVTFLIFILSSLGLLLARKYLSEDKIFKVEKFLRRNNLRIIFSLIIIYITIFLSLSILRYYNFKTHAYDLGVYTQAINSTIKGKPLDTPLRGHNFTGDHFMPVLFLLVPIYYFFPTPVVLLIIQTIFIGVSALPLYLISKKIFSVGMRNHPDYHIVEIPAMVIAFSLLLYPPLEFINLFDFHPDALIIASLLFCFYFLLLENYRLFFLFLLFSFLCKEQISLTGIIFGIYIMLKNKKIFWGMALLLFSLTWFYLSIFVIIPHFNPQGYIYLEEYVYLGETFIDKIRNLFLKPNLIINQILSPYRLGYLVLLFLPVGFISLASPLLLLFALPHLMINLLCKSYKVSSIFFQHNTPIIPFIFLTLIYGMQSLKMKFSNDTKERRLCLRAIIPHPQVFFICLYILLISIFSHFFFSPSPFSLTFWYKNYRLGEFKTLNFHYSNYFPQDKKHNILLKRILLAVPSDSIISAQGHLVPYVINKGTVYMFPEIKNADYIILDLKGSIYPYPKKEDFLKEIEKINKKMYRVIYKKGDILVFKKKY